MLGPEDEKHFKQISKVLKKDATPPLMFPVSYVQLSKLEPLVQAAGKFESALHKKTKEDKSTTWMLKMAKDADLDIG